MVYLIGIAVLAGLGVLLVHLRRQRRLTLTSQTVRCPEHDCPASLAVLTDSDAPPSRRHVDVTACSLLPGQAFVPATRTAYLSDLCQAGPYPHEVDATPRHADRVNCSKPCLPVLNAGESGPGAEPIPCTSGISDSLELARRTLSPAITRVMWHHSA